jgi:hypothetical protein
MLNERAARSPDGGVWAEPGASVAPGVWFPRAAPGMRWTETDGTFILSHPGDDRVHVLNQVGVLLLELANGRHSVEEMISILQRAFGLDHAPDADVRQFLERAVQAGLVE